MSLFHRIWPGLASRPHTRALEAEVARQGAEIARASAEIARLRAENRALLNSILGIAGVPPIPVTSPDPRPANLHSESAALDEESLVRPPLPGTEAAKRDSSGKDVPRNDISYHVPTPPQVAAPTRRRSWHQISRMFELESARKSVTRDG